jgi:ABC-type transport system involved in multi-copper enzyme maturation permease subunit
MVGPVLYQEMLLGARRNRAYVFRWCYAGWILLQLSFLLWIQFMMAIGTRRDFDYTAFAEFARSYLEILVTQHYLVILLATPVLTAGAITDEKWRGTLQYLLVTELFSWEILIGKLIGRLYQVFLLSLTPLPLMCFLGVFGGIDLLILLSLGVSSLAMAFALGSMSLLASVLCRHTRDAVLGLYTVGLLFYLGAAGLRDLLSMAGGASVWRTWLDVMLNCLDPLHPMGTGWAFDDPGERGLHLLASVAAWGILGLVSLVLAAVQLRASYLRYLEHSSKHTWWPVLLVFVATWSGVGLVLLVPYLALRGQLLSYLDGTSPRPWGAALSLFLLGWNAVGLMPLLLLIGFLSFTGRSTGFLDGLYELLQKSWLTRRARIAGDPLRWKERHVEGVAPLALLRAMPRWLGMMLVFLVTSASSIYLLSQYLPAPHTVGTVVKMMLTGDWDQVVRTYQGMARCDSAFSGQGFTVMMLAGLVIAIRCSGAVTGEREKNTWEALLLTPLETKQLIRSKLWGIIGASLPYLLAYAVPALGFSAIGGPGAVFWTVLWLGVTLLGMVFVGATGLWCSVRAKSSWRSLLSTLGITYVGGFILSCLMSPIIFFVALMLFLIWAMIEARLGLRTAPNFMVWLDFFQVGMCLTLAGFFALMAWRFIASAEYRVGILERVKHWRDEPKHPRWSRYGREQRRQLARDES